MFKKSQYILCTLSIFLLLSSCYGPLVTGYSDSYDDSTITMYEQYSDGTIKAKKEIKYINKRKTEINQQTFLPPNPLANAGDTGETVVDTVLDAEIIDKEFRLDENLVRQKRKLTSYYDGASIIKEKTKSKTKIKDGCEILIRKKTRIYDDQGLVIFKENFNFLYWRQVRKIYDEGGAKLETRTIKFMFKPKFRNYP